MKTPLQRVLMVLSVALLPQAVFAAATLTGIIGAYATSLSNIAGLLVAVALVIFLWGVVQFIAQAGDEKARTIGRQKIVWGIVGLVIIITFWGVVTILRSAAGTSNATTCSSPQIDITTGSVTTIECQP